MIDPRTITRETIYELAQKEPAIHVALSYYHRGDISFEQALFTCIFLLTEQSVEQNRILVENISNFSFPDSRLIQRLISIA